MKWTLTLLLCLFFAGCGGEGDVIEYNTWDEEFVADWLDFYESGDLTSFSVYGSGASLVYPSYWVVEMETHEIFYNGYKIKGEKRGVRQTSLREILYDSDTHTLESIKCYVDELLGSRQKED